MWAETGAFGGNPCSHKEIMQTLQRQHQLSGLIPGAEAAALPPDKVAASDKVTELI